MLAALASSPATKALDPDPFPRHSLRHPVYAALLHFGFETADFKGLGFNPLRVIDRQSRVAYLDVAGAIRDIFVAIYPELGDIQGERIRGAIKDSFKEQGWDDPSADMEKLAEPAFGRFVAILRADPKPDRGLRTLLARLEELDDYGFFDVTESHESLWDSAQPIVIRIHTTRRFKSEVQQGSIDGMAE